MPNQFWIQINSYTFYFTNLLFQESPSHRNQPTNGIIKVLSLKADKTEVDRLDELKQSKEEAESFMDLIV